MLQKWFSQMLVAASRLTVCHLHLISFFIYSKFQCDPKHNFTCWDGHCISIDKRCDLIDDCPDRSDEHMCRYIKIDKARYRDVFPPIPPNGEKLKVFVGFVLFDIVDIDEPKARGLYIFVLNFTSYRSSNL